MLQEEQFQFQDTFVFKDDDTTERFCELKEQAKTHFAHKKYLEAYQLYEQALSLTEFKDELSTLHSNMAQCCLYLRQYELALHHVHKSLKQAQTDMSVLVRIKTKYRLAQAMLQLRDYKKCSEVLRNLKTYCNMESELQMAKMCNAMWETASKLSSQQQGKFTGKDLFVQESEVGNYVSEKVACTGRKLIAQSLVKRGEMVLGAVGLSGKTQDEVTQKLFMQLQQMPLTTTLVLTHAFQLDTPNMQVFTQPLTSFVIQNQHKSYTPMTYEQVAAMVKNKLHFDRDNWVVFMAPSLVRHSCAPNCTVTYFKPDSSVVFLKSKHDLAAGEELTLSLVDLTLGYSERQQVLRERYGIQCECKRCEYERTADLGQEYEQVSALLTDQETPFISVLDSFISQIDSCTPGTQFNPHHARSLLQMLHNLNKRKFQVGRNEVIPRFHAVQQRCQQYLNSFQLDYPELLCECLDISYAFRSTFEQRTNPDDLPIYSEIDAQSEERTFSQWEQLYALVYPQDWYESSYVFNRRIKDCYEQRNS